jgi:hypothetical protein
MIIVPVSLKITRGFFSRILLLDLAPFFSLEHAEHELLVLAAALAE